jgi:hypothetical protein
MKKILIKMSFFAIVGAILGYVYYYFIGCRTGSCPLTGNPLITTLYGMLMGTILGFDSRIFQLKQKKDGNNS